jgi:hypothetical protein
MNLFELASNLQIEEGGGARGHAGFEVVKLSPPELDRYYRSLFAKLYREFCSGNYLLDVFVNLAVQEQSYAHWSWHSVERERIVLHVGAVDGFGPIAAAAGNPRQAVYALGWPNEKRNLNAVHWNLPEKLEQLVPSARLTLVSLEQLAQLPSGSVGTLILNQSPEANAALEYLRPVLERCDRFTEVICCGRSGDNLLVEEVVKSLNSTGRRLKVDSGKESGEVLYLHRPEHRLRAGPASSPSATYNEIRPVITSLDQISADSIYRVSPELRVDRPKIEFIAGKGVNLDAAVRSYDYFADSKLTLPASDYFILHQAGISERGVITDSAGTIVSPAMTPYFQPDPGISTHTPINPHLLPGTWIYLSSGGAAHTHFLIEGLLRTWIKDYIPNITGWLTPVSLRKYQREMLNLAFGELPVVEIDVVRRSFVAERLVAWRCGVGYSYNMSAMLDRMCRSASSIVSRPERIMIQRSDRPLYRRCLNEGEVLDLGRRYGYTVIDPGALSAIEEVSVFSSAKRIVGAIGAGIHNSIFAGSGAKVLAYTASGFAEPHLVSFSLLRGFDLSVLFCDQIEGWDSDPSCGLRASSYYVDIEALAQELDRLS